MSASSFPELGSRLLLSGLSTPLGRAELHSEAWMRLLGYATRLISFVERSPWVNTPANSDPALTFSPSGVDFERPCFELEP